PLKVAQQQFIEAACRATDLNRSFASNRHSGRAKRFKRARVGKANGNRHGNTEADAERGDRRTQLFARERTQNELPKEFQVRAHLVGAVPLSRAMMPSRMRISRAANAAASAACVARMTVTPVS